MSVLLKLKVKFATEKVGAITQQRWILYQSEYFLNCLLIRFTKKCSLNDLAENPALDKISKYVSDLCSKMSTESFDWLI